ncbi:MAG: hypothetical protein JWO36_6095 [Myxococcales bacterium]|nr:hypothetical protein [Myxococcales bacterium]
MSRPWLISLVLAVCAGCPPKPGPQTQAPNPVAGAGCPAASGVYVASYVTQEPTKGRSGWVVPLQAMKLDSGATVPEYQSLDATAASASGVPAAPAGRLWLMTASSAPCSAKVGNFYAAKIDGPPASLSYGVELEGCAAPTDPQEGGGIVLVSQDSPGACRFETPHPVAARMGETDAQKQWQRPTKETPIPAAVSPLIPVHECKPPGCETLWAIGEVDVNNQPVAWSGAVNWLAIGTPAAQCEWKAERFSGFFVPGPGGTAVKVTEGQDHPLVLSAALVDNTGPKVLLAEGPGQYATYDFAAGAPALGHRVTWMLAPNEAFDAVDHLGPICEPPSAKPAPLPKDAKPLSPYP